MSDNEEFDDWYNDGEACGAELQNQAASLDDAKEEEREVRAPGTDEGQIGAPATRLGGQLVLKFIRQEDGQEGFQRASAHIAHAMSDFWVALTARHSFTLAGWDFDSGSFLLNRTGPKQAAAIFRFTKEDVQHYAPDHELTEKNMHLCGKNLTAIKLTEKQVAKINGAKPDVGELIGDVPELSVYDDSNFDDKESTTAHSTVSGYPDQIVVKDEGLQANSEMQMYSNGFREIAFRSVHLFGCSALTSPGQHGGAMTTLDGRVLAIYTGVDEHPEYDGGRVGLCVRMHEEVVQWVTSEVFE